MQAPIKDDEEQRKGLLRPTSDCVEEGVVSLTVQEGIIKAQLELVDKPKVKLSGRGSTLLDIANFFTLNSIIMQVTAVLLPRWAIFRESAGNPVNASIGLWENCTHGMHNFVQGEVCHSLETIGISITPAFRGVQACGVLSVLLVVGCLVTGYAMYRLRLTLWSYILNMAVRASLCIVIGIGIGVWKNKVAFLAASMGGSITLQIATICQEMMNLGLVIGSCVRFHGPRGGKMCKTW